MLYHRTVLRQNEVVVPFWHNNHTIIISVNDDACAKIDRRVTVSVTASDIHVQGCYFAKSDTVRCRYNTVQNIILNTVRQWISQTTDHNDSAHTAWDTHCSPVPVRTGYWVSIMSIGGVKWRVTTASHCIFEEDTTLPLQFKIWLAQSQGAHNRNFLV